MSRLPGRSAVWAVVVTLLSVAPLRAQADRRTRVDVDTLALKATVNPRTQSLVASARIGFKAVDDNITSVTFELHNALNVSRITDDAGVEMTSTRSQSDSTLRIALPQPLPKGQAKTVIVNYEGRLTGNEESPVYGIKFAAIKEDGTFLMYPARWFPVNEYTVDRYTAQMDVTVPTGYRVLGAGAYKGTPGAEGLTFNMQPSGQATFGSIAVVKDEAPAKASAKGITTECFFKTKKEYCGVYAEEVGNSLTFLTSLFGLPPSANITLVETEAGTPNGYSTPGGLIFLAPGSIAEIPPQRVLTNQLARQWWGNGITPTTRNHLWLINGMAKYAEALYLENLNGAASMEGEMRDAYVDALTVNEAPLIQTSRIEDYSPEYWAMTASKGASVLNMLRTIMGDQKFSELLKKFAEENRGKAVNTEGFKKAAEAVSGQSFQNFFVQWIESTGAPEFRLEYTVFRAGNNFRIMGKISQDLDTFRMPVDLAIETEGNPERKTVDVVGTASEFVVDSFGKPKRVTLDPDNKVLRYSPKMRVAVAIRRGEQLVDVGELNEALKEYQRALDVQRGSSLAHYRIAEVFFLQSNLQSAANEFREALNGDLDPRWIEVWSHINLGKIFDITGQRERAVNEYNLAVRTKDNTSNAQLEAAKYIKEPYKRQQTEQ